MQWDEMGGKVGKMTKKRALNTRPQRVTDLLWVRAPEGGKRQAGSTENRPYQRPPCRSHFRNPRVSPFSLSQQPQASVYLYDSPLSLLYQQNMQFHSSTLPPKLVPSPEISQNCVSFIPWQAALRVLPRLTCCWPGLPTLVYVVFLTHGPFH